MKQTKEMADVRSSQRPGRRERTRRALVEMAIRIIAKKGIARTSVLDITEALEISNGSFYYHFQNMDQLLEEVGHVVVASLGEQIESVIRPDPAAQIARGPLIILRYVSDHPELRAILLRVIQDPEGAHVDLQDHLREDVIRGQQIGRFPIRDIEVAVAFSRVIVGAAVRITSDSANFDDVGITTAAHTLAMLGVPLWEAHTIAAKELALLDRDGQINSDNLTSTC